MEVIEKIGKATANTCKVTVCKTNKLAQRAKLRMHINECKDMINEQYALIGKKVYEKHVREEDIDISRDLQSECAKIDKFSKEIDNSIEQLLILKNIKKCPGCFMEINIDYNFCPNCGKKQNNEDSRENKIVDKLQNEDINKENEQEANIIIDEKLEDIEE